MNYDLYISVLTCLFQSIVSFMLFDNYMVKRTEVPKWVYIVGIIILAVGMQVSNIFLKYKYWNLLCIMGIMFFITFFYESDIKTRITLSVVMVLIATCSEMVVLSLVTLLKGVSKTEAYMNPQLKIMGIILSKTMTLAIVRMICLFSKKRTIKMSVLYWWMYITVFAVSLLTIYLIFSSQDSGDKLYMSVICAVGLLYSVLITLYLYERMAAQAEKLKEKELLEQQFNDQVSHLKELVLAQEQISTFHDISNHMVSLKSYLDCHNYDEGNAYLAKLIQKTDLYSDVIDTGNTVIDAILTSKRNLARKNNIEFNVDLQISDNLLIDSSDCSVILGNALDNAIEACERIKGKKYINMRMVYHDTTLICKITNPAPDDCKNNNELKTTKTDKQNHGIGTKNIKRTLEKYNNTYRMEYDNGEFVFSFILYDIFVKPE